MYLFPALWRGSKLIPVGALAWEEQLQKLTEWCDLKDWGLSFTGGWLLSNVHIVGLFTSLQLLSWTPLALLNSRCACGYILFIQIYPLSWRVFLFLKGYWGNFPAWPVRSLSGSHTPTTQVFNSWDWSCFTADSERSQKRKKFTVVKCNWRPNSTDLGPFETYPTESVVGKWNSQQGSVPAMAQALPRHWCVTRAAQDNGWHEQNWFYWAWIFSFTQLM